MTLPTAPLFETWTIEGERYVQLPEKFDYYDLDALAAVRAALDELG